MVWQFHDLNYFQVLWPPLCSGNAHRRRCHTRFSRTKSGTAGRRWRRRRTRRVASFRAPTTLSKPLAPSSATAARIYATLESRRTTPPLRRTPTQWQSFLCSTPWSTSKVCDSYYLLRLLLADLQLHKCGHRIKKIVRRWLKSCKSASTKVA